ncbi:MAG: neutral/alkaline non-lysosomal ceramidase N-terminal domain-containing protein [Planctomycetota bacterium]|nr:neutral/alkaline non-lysosomal ceramidase N-terminal domain-containing protein [Planctomycetota bacterium]
MNYRRAALLIFVLFVTSPILAASNWQAGTARVKLTPDQFMWMSGYGGRTVPADGKLTDIWAKALVLRDATGKDVVLITADLIGIGAESTHWVKEQLHKNHGLKREQVAIATSHTHTGPALSDNLVPLHYLRADEVQQNRIVEYTLMLRQMLVDVVGLAYKDLEKVYLTSGNGLCTVAVNRRNNSEAQVPRKRLEGMLNGPYDHDVPVLAVRNADYELKTVVFGYACHSTVLSFTQWSGDYPGFAQIELEKIYPGVNAMFWAGCGADQNPLPRRTVELAKHYGQRVAQSVDSVLRGTMASVEGTLVAHYKEIDGRTQEPIDRDRLNELLANGNQYEKPYAQYLLKQLGSSVSLPNSYPYPIQTWHLGDIRMVFLGGEVVVDYAVKLKQHESGAKDTNIWVAGYSNDVMAYIPSTRVLREGGYEGGTSNTYYGFPALWSEEFEGQILKETRRQMNTK